MLGTDGSAYGQGRLIETRVQGSEVDGAAGVGGFKQRETVCVDASDDAQLALRVQSERRKNTRART